MRVLVDSEGLPVGKFDREKAEEVYDDRDTNGEGRILLRTASGRLVLAVVSQWANIPPIYMVDDEAVIDFCRANNLDLPDDTGEALENLDAGGRPEIGPAFSLRFQPDLLAKVDAAAEREGISRAEWVRRAALAALAARGEQDSGDEVGGAADPPGQRQERPGELAAEAESMA